MVVTNTPFPSALELHSTPMNHDALGLRETKAAESAALAAASSSTQRGIYLAYSGPPELQCLALFQGVPPRAAKRDARTEAQKPRGRALPRRLLTELCGLE